MIASKQIAFGKAAGKAVKAKPYLEFDFTQSMWIPKDPYAYNMEVELSFSAAQLDNTRRIVLGNGSGVRQYFDVRDNKFPFAWTSTPPIMEVDVVHKLTIKGNVLGAVSIALDSVSLASDFYILPKLGFAIGSYVKNSGTNFAGRIFRVTLYDEGGNVLHDFIPSVVDGVPCLKDDVGDIVVYADAGTANPVYGELVDDEVDYTAKDYVQDGLVAMWDVVENISLGESDHSQPYVYNIAPNGPDFTINDVTFDEATMSYSTPRSASYAKIDPALVNGFVNRNCTVEFLAAGAKSAANGWGAAADLTVNGFSYVFVSSGDNVLRISKDGTQTWDALAPTDKLHSSIVISGNTMSSYCGGLFDRSATFSSQGYQYVTQFGFLSIPRYNTSYASGMRCFRLYNRALTAEEIAHNYSIDKARFGL